ncbi:hypothetical protein TeGR_g2935 [Tetraparma gracilis]|uniref:Fatty acid desaturase domain-containing protein n=1 Tax=Tetraparma gracilis TaxID=2962635 RepID=A0ABQ6MQI2_9STRA|nr:hypothetical protein TeGR_g2935 [Tetraparma gracilis]
MGKETYKSYYAVYVLDAVVMCSICLFSIFHYLNSESLLWSVPVALAEAKLGLIAHEASHQCRGCPFFLAWLYDTAMGSHSQWMAKHNKGHHLKTNTLEDPDMQMSPIMRVHPAQPRNWWHKYQHIYQLPLFFCVAWSLRIQGIIHINTSPTVSWKEFLTHYILAAPATFLYIVLPLYMKGPKGLAFFFMCNGILGITYGLLFSVSHVNTLVQFDPTGTQLEKQMRTTADYNSGSWLVNYLTGGLNHQVVHHMYPHVPSYEYPALARKIREENPAEYRDMGSFPAAVWSNMKYLMKSGVTDPAPKRGGRGGRKSPARRGRSKSRGRAQ